MALISTGSLIKSKFQLVALQNCWKCCQNSRYFASWKTKLINREEKENKVFQYVGNNQKRADRVYVWGNAVTGALGIREFLRPEKNRAPVIRRNRPFRLTFLDQYDLKLIDAGVGYGFTVLVLKSKDAQIAYGTGLNTDSQLGFQEYPPNSNRILDYVIELLPIKLPLSHPSTTKVLKAACGRAHTVIVTDKEGVFTLGNNSYGQCGRPIVEGEQYRGNQTINKIEIPGEIDKVICGQDHTLFLNDVGEVYSCGLGGDGQTGQGHYECIEKPTKVNGDIKGEKIVDLACRSDSILAVSDKGDVFGWGNSEYNQFSMVSDESQLALPKHLKLNVGKVKQVASGGTINAVLNEKNQVFVWGFGILGKGPNLESSDKPVQIPDTLFGRNELNPNSKVKSIGCGLHHFYAVTDQGDLYTWGYNKQGALGLGHLDNQFFPYKVCLSGEVEWCVSGVDHMVVKSKAYA